MIIQLINTIYQFLWGDFIRIPLPGGSSLGISLLILLLIPTGIFFTIRTHFLPIRLFPDMLKALTEKKNSKNSLSSFQALIVSTATRVGMGNLVGVVAAVSAGGAGAGHRGAVQEGAAAHGPAVYIGDKRNSGEHLI